MKLGVAPERQPWQSAEGYIQRLKQSIVRTESALTRSLREESRADGAKRHRRKLRKHIALLEAHIAAATAERDNIGERHPIVSAFTVNRDVPAEDD